MSNYYVFNVVYPFIRLFYNIFRNYKAYRVESSKLMAKKLDFDIVGSEFELQSCYYVHFRTDTIWKGMNPLITQARG